MAEKQQEPEKKIDRAILQIDKYNLDEAWEKQASEHGCLTDLLADEKKELAELEAALEVVISEIKKDFREDPNAFGFEKVTEGSVKEVIPLQKRYQRANQRLINQKHKVDILTGLVKSHDQKKKGLEDLVDLWLNDYWAEPRPSEHSKEKVDELKKKLARRKGTKRRGEDDDE